MCKVDARSEPVVPVVPQPVETTFPVAGSGSAQQHGVAPERIAMAPQIARDVRTAVYPRAPPVGIATEVRQQGETVTTLHLPGSVQHERAPTDNDL